MADPQTSPAPRHHRAAIPRRAFTLFEVAMSLLVLGTGILIVVALMPRSLEQLQMSRQRIFASAVALEMLSDYQDGTMQQNWFGVDDYTFLRSPTAPDLEHMGTRNYLFAPLPPDIQRRIDSEDDEIASLTAQGAALFYLIPQKKTALAEGADTDLLPAPLTSPGNAEASHAIVFAVVGKPQMNATWHTPRFTTRSRSGVAGNYNSSGRPRDALLVADPGNQTGSRRTTFFHAFGCEGVIPRKGYFFEHQVRVQDPTANWYAQAYDFQNDTALPVLREETDSLFRPFRPAERCRQIVFWACDWKSYEDAEFALGVDADVGMTTTGLSRAKSREGSEAGENHPYHYERSLWWTPPSTAPAFVGADSWWVYRKSTALAALAAGQDWKTALPHTDRNFNGKADFGPLPRSARIRAKTLMRTNFYDRRLYTTSY